MGYQDYISESEAANLAGVSTKTLNRFAEAGYLQIEEDSDGLRLFSKSALCEVFGLPSEKLESKGSKPVSPPTASHSIKSEKWHDSSEIPSGPARTQSAKVVRWESPVERQRTRQNVEAQSPQAGFVAHTSSAPQAAPSLHIAEDMPSTNSRAIEKLEDELTKLKNVSNLQERLLDMRESEILDLKKQRDWLQRRIERLEEKGERDQLLLLSETQVVRQMITHQQIRRSPVRAALEWLGMSAPAQVSEPPKSTIEVKNS